MKMFHFQKVILTLLLSVVAVTVTTTAEATLVCDTWDFGGSTSQSIYNCNFLSDNYGGSYVSSYNCYDDSYRDYCTINYTGGNSYQGTCRIVFVCGNGQSYYCDVNNWNGEESIQCDDVPRDCTGIYVCQNPPAGVVSPVPEPSTILAGVLLVIPLAISTVRILCNRRAAGDV